MRSDGCFVTGADAVVGKTQRSAALLYRLGRAEWGTAGYKRVAAGTIESGGARVNEDVRALRTPSSAAVSDADICQFQFAMPCAPPIAAAVEAAPARSMATAALRIRVAAGGRARTAALQQRLKRGELVAAMIGAANREPRRHPMPTGWTSAAARPARCA